MKKPMFRKVFVPEVLLQQRAAGIKTIPPAANVPLEAYEKPMFRKVFVPEIFLQQRAAGIKTMPPAANVPLEAYEKSYVSKGIRSRGLSTAASCWNKNNASGGERAVGGI